MTHQLIEKLKKEFELFTQIREAEDFFIRQEYHKALLICFDILDKNPDYSRAQIIVLLIQVAASNEIAAQELFELYFTLQANTSDLNIKEIILDKIDNLAIQVAKFSMFTKSLKQGLFALQDGITYSDFKNFVVKNKGFKRAFQDIHFTSKVIIEDKKDLIDFINNLIDHGFQKEALNYLEEGLKLFPKDYELNLLAKMVFNKTEKEKL